MKKRILLLLILPSFVYGQKNIQEQTPAFHSRAFGSTQDERIDEMKNASPDMGTWIGLRAGVQTNGGDMMERWAVVGMYEWRFSRTLSVPVELYLFRHRGWAFNEVGKRQKVFENRPMLSVGLKLRLGSRKVNAYLQGGIEYLSGSGFFLGTLNYATGAEFFLSEKVSVYANIHKNIIRDDWHFITIGTNLMVDSFIR